MIIWIDNEIKQARGWKERILLRIAIIISSMCLPLNAYAASERFVCSGSSSNSKWIAHIGDPVLALSPIDEDANKVFYTAAEPALVVDENSEVKTYKQWNQQLSWKSHLSLVYWFPKQGIIRNYYFAVNLDKRDDAPRAKLSWEMRCKPY